MDLQVTGSCLSAPRAAEARDALSVKLNLVQQMLPAPPFHALEAKCCFPTSATPYPPPWSRSSKVGVGSAVPSAVSTNPWVLEPMAGTRSLTTPSSLWGRCISASSCQLFLSKQLGVWAAACSLKASEIFVTALLVLILLEQK